MSEFPGPIDIFVAGAVFVIGWVYAVAAYGFFLGGGLGWVPAACLAIVAFFVWRFVASIAILAAVGLACWIYLSK